MIQILLNEFKAIILFIYLTIPLKTKTPFDFETDGPPLSPEHASAITDVNFPAHI